MMQDSNVVLFLHPREYFVVHTYWSEENVEEISTESYPGLFSKLLHFSKCMPVKLSDRSELLLIEHDNICATSPAP